ncbi:NAD(P)-dependent oxidoreductase [Brumimicrobium oceani]|uniref:Saccharopine dehydrogenase [NAD(+), L-lysine-forming] n=1 Tax=Brumimicrobium oceani TaxID=2100725 RepID=A0A2U2XHC1_9FLAO|nr:NAD(P)-dependent oxidoreductase [Brumimicrobium oceani]PWH87111.1 alanine dehydrogenase [Brumimicrobium oceani]
MTTKIGIIREGKNPPDARVPLSPEQCLRVMEEYPNVKLVVQKSEVRAFKDNEYSDLGIPIVDSLEDCDIIMGVKEVNIEDLIPQKQYFFFSHTFKEQPYNRDLLKAIIERRIQLTDYEVLTDKNDKRIIGFGRYAGIVGCYNGFLTYGLKNALYTLKPAHQCADRKEMESELEKVILPKDTKIVITGFGRVGHGALEVINKLPITEVSPEEFLDDVFDEPVFTHLGTADYVARDDEKEFDRDAFFEDGSGHHSTFNRYLKEADLYIACHYWENGSPFLVSRDELKSKDRRVSVIADISCDIDGPVASTIRPSTIANPIYGYDPETESEVDFRESDAIAVMAVDNLPCELPKDAAIDFGNELIKNVLPALFGEDPHSIIERGSQTSKDGKLTHDFKYLSAYLAGKESVEH